jgi:hypothetical protein
VRLIPSPRFAVEIAAQSVQKRRPRDARAAKGRTG